MEVAGTFSTGFLMAVRTLFAGGHLYLVIHPPYRAGCYDLTLKRRQTL